jgi:nicotinate dehydrogenase subunit A
LTALRCRIVVNGQDHTIVADDGDMLLPILRNDLRLNGPKYGCGLGECGACTVLAGGLPARSCIMSVAALRGRAITTLEGLAQNGVLHPAQRAFIQGQGAQCGYCLNGMIMATVALLAAVPKPSDAQVRASLKHHLCRCGAHAQILESVRLAIAMSLEARGVDGHA